VKIAGGNGNGQLNENDLYLKVGSKLEVRALVDLGRLTAQDISVELYNGSVDSWGNISDGVPVSMQCESDQGQGGARWFRTELLCNRSGNMGVSVRVVPHNDDLASPWEPGLILWEGDVKK
jgi:starch phosphorylase